LVVDRAARLPVVDPTRVVVALPPVEADGGVDLPLLEEGELLRGEEGAVGEGLEDDPVAPRAAGVAHGLLEEPPVEHGLAAQEGDLLGWAGQGQEVVDRPPERLEVEPGGRALVDGDVAIAAGEVAAIGQIDGQMILAHRRSRPWRAPSAARAAPAAAAVA